VPRIRKLSNQEIASLHPDDAAAPQAVVDVSAPAPEEAPVTPARRRRRRSDDAPADGPGDAPVAAEVAEPRAEPVAPRPDTAAPRQPPAAAPIKPPEPPEPPEEAVVQLLPVELPLAERRGELVHLTLGADVTLCGTPCDSEPASSRPYSVAAGCQRCARMLHRLKARCESCGRPLLHLAGNGACIRCGHIGAVIQLP
jgi:hypothetical protein